MVNHPHHATKSKAKKKAKKLKTRLKSGGGGAAAAPAVQPRSASAAVAATDAPPNASSQPVPGTVVAASKVVGAAAVLGAHNAEATELERTSLPSPPPPPVSTPPNPTPPLPPSPSSPLATRYTATVRPSPPVTAPGRGTKAARRSKKRRVTARDWQDDLRAAEEAKTALESMLSPELRDALVARGSGDALDLIAPSRKKKQKPKAKTVNVVPLTRAERRKAKSAAKKLAMLQVRSRAGCSLAAGRCIAVGCWWRLRGVVDVAKCGVPVAPS